MKIYAIVLNGIVQDVLPPNGAPPADILHPTLAAAAVDVTGLATQPQRGWTFDGQTFASPVTSLAALRDAAVQALRSACQAYLMGGFPSSALGTAHTYPSDEVSQRNLAMDVATASDAGMWCCAAGTWAWAAHNVTQLRQVAMDWVAYRSAAQQRLAGLVSQVQAATTTADVQGATW